MAQTLFDKLWTAHLVTALEDGADLIFIDRVFLHERTGSIALKSLEAEGRSLRNPALVFCTMDHIVDTFPGRTDDTIMPSGKDFIQSTRASAHKAGITLFDLGDSRQGIVHVVSPEQGVALPGATIVCPDSHTCTQGALGALAWGIGSTEAEHAMVTGTLRVNRPKTMRVLFNGDLGLGVTAKDMILHLIGKHTAAGASGYAVEFAGDAVEALSMEARFTLCNMAVEFSAFTGMVAVDDTTLNYVKGRPFAPKGALWDKAVSQWRALHSDKGAAFDKEIVIEAQDIKPTVTWGASPEHAIPIDGKVPDPATARSENQRASMKRALAYMDVKPGQILTNLSIDAAFIGSCTNARLSDLRAAATLLNGRHVAKGVKAICVPGSTQVKLAAEAEGLDKIFTKAGFEWRESGCSMCFFAGGEHMGYRERVISTTNRNFESRQGPETRTHLASPLVVAASAVTGVITDPRDLMRGGDGKI